jgi:type IV pilus assembly protein PilA
MKPIKMIKTKVVEMKKKAFTLIELLIVVAIIGILAGVGVPMYNGYMATAKVQSATTNHKNVKSFVAATLTKCSTGSQYVTLGSSNRYCNQNASTWAGYFITYFNSINKNPYGKNVFNGTDSATSSGGPRLGLTGIGSSGNRIAIRTNIGNESGGSAFIPDSGWIYITKE